MDTYRHTHTLLGGLVSAHSSSVYKQDDRYVYPIHIVPLYQHNETCERMLLSLLKYMSLSRLKYAFLRENKYAF